MESNSGAKNAEKESLVLPKGNWTKQMKYFPKKFTEMCIQKHFNRYMAKKHFQNGYRMFKAGKVSKVQLSIGATFNDVPLNVPYCLFLKSKVQASFTLATAYNVAAKLNGCTGAVEKGMYNCKAGKGGVCIHVSALLWHMLDCLREGKTFIPDDQACTQKERQWGVPNCKGALATEHFENLQFVRHTPAKSSELLNQRSEKLKKYSSLRDHGKLEDDQKLQHRIAKLSTKLQGSSKSKFFAKILEENHFVPDKVAVKETDIMDVVIENTDVRIPLPLKIFDISLCNENSRLTIVYAIGKTSPVLKLTLEAAQRLESDTKAQSNCDMWKAERLQRLTASKFGVICKRKKEVTECFIKSLITSTDLSKSKFVREGLDNENAVTKKYRDLRGNVETFSVGFCVNPSLPMLGATPDRLVLDKTTGEYGLLEIKTLSKCKFQNISVKNAFDKREPTAKFLKMDENGSLYCDKNHNHYFQIQGQLGISGLPWCDLTVDCGDDAPFLERIVFNEELFKNKMLPKLTCFYASHVIPFLKKQSETMPMF